MSAGAPHTLPAEGEPEPIGDAESAWRVLLLMANSALTTNDPLIGYACTSIAAELRAARLIREDNRL